MFFALLLYSLHTSNSRQSKIQNVLYWADWVEHNEYTTYEDYENELNYKTIDAPVDDKYEFTETEIDYTKKANVYCTEIYLKGIKMLEIKYSQALVFISLIWIITRCLVRVKEACSGRPGKIPVKQIFLRELELLMVYVCIIVIVRIVYFPMRHVNGHIGYLFFDSSQILPFRINLIPLVRLADVYDGWQLNIIGNVTMFIPVGIVWPVCFKKLDKLWKATLAGGGFSLFIEITQLLFYERCSDIDDLLMNTSGVFIGAVIYFLIRRFKKK